MVTLLVCGIAILSVLFGSVKELDLSDYSYEIRKQEMISEKMVSELDEVNDALNRSIIEEKCETYILDKAELNNIEIKGVSVLADWSTDGFWYPCSAEIILTQGNQEKDTLAYYINSELGITEENICWRYENDTT